MKLLGLLSSNYIKRGTAMATAVLMLLLVANPGMVFAAPKPKVDICHATGSNSNPYNSANADQTADVGGHDGHEGPVWFDGIEEDWGDIIPPFDYDGGSYPGKNWTTEGQAIWNNGCSIPEGDPTYSISGYKFNDLNNNGEWDQGEPGLPNWEIWLDMGSNESVDETTLTDQNGFYSFEGLANGPYAVGETQQNGWTQTAPLQPNFYQVEVDDADVTDRNFGNHQDEEVPVGVTIVAHKIVCTNEADLPNWGVEIGNPNIDANTAADWVAQHEGCHFQEGWNFQWGPQTATEPADSDTLIGPAGGEWQTMPATDGNGMSSVTLTGEDYGDSGYLWFREELQEGYIPFTFHTNGDTDVDNVSAEVYCHVDAYHYDNFDRIDGIQPGSTYYCVGFNALQQGEPILSEIDGFKYNDLNGNGMWDEGEPGLEGWTIYLDLNGNGVLDGDEPSTVTLGDGSFAFEGLLPGPYIIREVNQNGWLQTGPSIGDNGEWDIVLGSTAAMGINFFNHQVCNFEEQYGWYGRYYDYAGEGDNKHPDMNLDPSLWPDNGHGDPLSDEGAWNTDWYDAQYLVDTQVDPNLNFGPFFPLDGLGEDPVGSGHNYHFGVHWTAKVLIPLAGTYNYSITSDDDAWVYFDGNLNTNMAGIHAPTTLNDDVTLSAGVHVVDIFFAERHTVDSYMDFSFEDELTIVPWSEDCIPGDDDDDNGGNEGGYITGLKWGDLDGDGIWDENEVGLGGWTIFVDLNDNGTLDEGEPWTITGDGDGIADPNESTDSLGRYNLHIEIDGTFKVYEIGQNGWTQTYPVDPNYHEITVSNGMALDHNYNFGNHQNEDDDGGDENGGGGNNGGGGGGGGGGGSSTTTTTETGETAGDEIVNEDASGEVLGDTLPVTGVSVTILGLLGAVLFLIWETRERKADGKKTKA